MVFSSETFLFLFLPLFLAAYYSTPERHRSYAILLGSYVFYAWWRVDFLALLFLKTVWSFAFGILIERNRDTPRAKLHLAIGIGGCLAVLGVFKYLNFFVDSFAALLGTTPSELGVHWRMILPIGISFFVFQAISYLIDVYRKEVVATRNFADFAAFVALFPQLIAGPILRFKDLEHQFIHRRHSFELFSEGMTRFAIGLSKKVLLADAVAPLADAVFSQSDPTMLEAWMGAIAYMLQLYFDFSGYSDMAIGLGMMLGFRFVENFNLPYLSRSITEFWRRWHISLSFWLRDYLYIPLGGNRSGTVRTYLNLLIVMMLGGLWHGANWTFVLWGLWHGGWLAGERSIRWDKVARDHWFAWPLTLLVVLLGWVMFRATDVGNALDIYSGMLGLNGVQIRSEFAWQISREAIVMSFVAAVVAVYEVRFQNFTIGQAEPGLDGTLTVSQNPAATFAVTIVTAVTVMKLAEQSHSPFLYFQF
jgi:alginate O-acetyltransferase complex protein AlgI